MPLVGKQNSLIVQCALPIEARAVAARLRRARRGSLGLFEAWEGTMASVPVLVVVSGMGASEAAIATSEMIRMFEPCGVIDFGAAGSPNESWAIGKCALIATATAYQPPRLIPPSESSSPPRIIGQAEADADWLKVGQEVSQLPAVKAGCADVSVTNIHMARYLAAMCGFDWFDYETFSVLNVAAQHSVRAVGLRTISDHCGHNAPQQFEQYAKRALSRAAKVLEEYVAALLEARLLGA